MSNVKKADRVTEKLEFDLYKCLIIQVAGCQVSYDNLVCCHMIPQVLFLYISTVFFILSWLSGHIVLIQHPFHLKASRLRNIADNCKL